MDNFIPKLYKKDPVTIRIDIEKLARIDELARQYNTNRSEFINRCIDFAIENMEQSDK